MATLRVPKELAIAKDLSLPIDVVTQKNAFMGRTGSGKTYAATKLAELMLDAGAQIVVIDPVGVWYGLRLDKTGNAPSGFDIPVFGGLHGDIPLEATGGALLADLVVDRALSAILDVSMFEHDTDKARFARDFAARFFYRKKASPSAVHVFLEECQEFVPQNPQRGDEQMLHEFHRIAKQGRNFGIGISLISQRPQEINKKALNQTECMFAFQMTGPQERKAISLWVSEKGSDEDVADILPKLAIGEPHIWSPQWLEISREIRILPKRTFDASSTPTFGAKIVEAKPLGAIDLKDLEKKMASTIERQKETDPKALRAEVARLKRELMARPPGQRIAEQAQTDAFVKKAVENAVKANQRSHEQFRVKVRRDLERLQRHIGEIDLSVVIAAFDEGKPEATAPDRVEPMPTFDERPVVRTSRPAQIPAVQWNGKLSGTKQRTLNAIAQLHLLAVARPTVKQVAVFCGVSHTTGSFLQDVRDLAKAGYLERDRGVARLTPTGEKAASVDPPDRDLREMWLQKLDGPHSKMLEMILSFRSIDKNGLARELNVSPSTGSFLQNLRDLRNYGVIDLDNGVASVGELLR
ncbi:MAG: DUF87 domain-containing protein [Gemmatimonadota bacterium]|nr:DUF87 domain-containing protein [Gemmatimonadota bacterium]